jgi:phospholipid/cholesterol/gamma-HCH transport system substrate-binding protein
MISRAQKIRLAVFFVIGFAVLLIVLVFLIGSKITEKRDSYVIVYQDTSVAGLQIGGPVLYRGIRIGRIDDIQIDRERIMNIIVHISVKRGTPIKADQVATMVNIGITGLKQIELSGGTDGAPFLRPGDKIIPGRSLFDNITDTAEVLTAKIEVIIDNIIAITSQQNQIYVESILKNVSEFLEESQQPLVSTISNIENITSELAIATVTANDMLAKFNEVFDADKITNIITNTETVTASLAEIDFEKINTTIDSLNETLMRSNLLVTRVEAMVHKSSPDISASIEELREALENLNEFSRMIAEDPRILLRGTRSN